MGWFFKNIHNFPYFPTTKKGTFVLVLYLEVLQYLGSAPNVTAVLVHVVMFGPYCNYTHLVAVCLDYNLFFCEVFVSKFKDMTSQNPVAFKKQLLPSSGINLITNMYLNSNAHNFIKNWCHTSNLSTILYNYGASFGPICRVWRKKKTIFR